MFFFVTIVVIDLDNGSRDRDLVHKMNGSSILLNNKEIKFARLHIFMSLLIITL